MSAQFITATNRDGDIVSIRSDVIIAILGEYGEEKHRAYINIYDGAKLSAIGVMESHDEILHMLTEINEYNTKWRDDIQTANTKLLALQRTIEARAANDTTGEQYQSDNSFQTLMLAHKVICDVLDLLSNR